MSDLVGQSERNMVNNPLSDFLGKFTTLNTEKIDGFFNDLSAISREMDSLEPHTRTYKNKGMMPDELILANQSEKALEAFDPLYIFLHEKNKLDIFAEVFVFLEQKNIYDISFYKESECYFYLQKIDLLIKKQRDSTQKYIDLSGGLSKGDLYLNWVQHEIEKKQKWLLPSVIILFLVINFSLISSGSGYIYSISLAVLFIIFYVFFGWKKIYPLFIPYEVVKNEIYEMSREELSDNLPSYKNLQETFNVRMKNVEDYFNMIRTEITAETIENAKIYNLLKSHTVNTAISNHERYLALMDRLEMMKFDLEHAKKISENLAEQHEKTEAIRARYAREMMDAQAMLAEQSDQALKEKLAMVNAMMGV